MTRRGILGAGELGLVSVYPQRAWEALQAIGWSIQVPRPKNPVAASTEVQAAFKKTRRRISPSPRPVTLFCTDEHCIGLEPIERWVWAPRRQRPIALGHHHYPPAGMAVLGIAVR